MNLRPFLLLPILLAASCASDSDSSTSSDPSSPAPERKSFSERLNQQNGYTTDAEGNWVPKSNQRSSFETNRESPHFKGDYAKKDFKTEAFTKKSWWGDTKYESKKFEGDTDGSRFQSASKFQGKGAREAGSAADLPGSYSTSNYATNSARESTGSRIGRTSDAETDFRRRVYKAPSVIDWREQRSMNVSETKGILGR